FYYGFKNKTWNLWINNTPLIHMRSSDFHKLTKEEQNKFVSQITDTFTAFKKRYGADLIHMLYTFFSETSIIYHDGIIDAVNDLRFADIDFVFDLYFERLKTKRLSNCEITWCYNRATCKEG
ncbi:MAG: hypothetical protein KKD44_27330, partial [Proteobacteria bacterium]|nr:hypothetical protein [Pseudomonadota bacterium]